MLQRWNLLGRLDPNFHIVMPGDPPTLFPLSRCGLAGTISYGSLDVIVNIKRFAPFAQSQRRAK